MLWKASSSVSDFITQAKVYQPPNQKSSSSEKQNTKKESKKTGGSAEAFREIYLAYETLSLYLLS